MSKNTITDYAKQQQDQHLKELIDFLRIPSVSTDLEHVADIRKAAQWLEEELKRLGFAVEVIETAKHPVVYAEMLVDEALPTVLVYGHYDVQPVDPIELWDSDPFEPVVKDGLIIARGSSDDKGQVYAHIKGAEVLLQTGDFKTSGKLPVNLKFLIEGEEEIGSPNLDNFIASNKAKLAADVVLISDSAMVAAETPTITYGLKGLSYVEVRVKAASHDLHSGAFGGGVPNPINGLAKMIASLHDEQGRVAVPGFYDAVIDIQPQEREAFKRVPFDEKAFADELALDATVVSSIGEENYSLLERLWARPTLDCNGIAGGFQGEGAKTVIASEAMAKISCRLVPNQDHHEITKLLGDFLKANAPEGLSVEVIDLHGGKPALTPMDSPEVQAAAKALAEVYGKETIFARTGGTIPVVSTFQEALKAGVILVGLGLEDDRAHSPNEKFDLINYYRGIQSSATILKALAEI